MSALYQKQTSRLVIYFGIAQGPIIVSFDRFVARASRPSHSPSAFCDPGVTAFVINGLNFFVAQFFYTLQCGRIYYAVNRLPDGLLGPYKLVINTASSFVRCGSRPTGCAPAYEWECALTEPTFDCRIWQRGAECSRFALPPTPWQIFRTQPNDLMQCHVIFSTLFR
jgi:hypothetical protein